MPPRKPTSPLPPFAFPPIREAQARRSQRRANTLQARSFNGEDFRKCERRWLETAEAMVGRRSALPGEPGVHVTLGSHASVDDMSFDSSDEIDVPVEPPTLRAIEDGDDEPIDWPLFDARPEADEPAESRPLLLVAASAKP